MPGDFGTLMMGENALVDGETVVPLSFAAVELTSFDSSLLILAGFAVAADAGIADVTVMVSTLASISMTRTRFQPFRIELFRNISSLVDGRQGKEMAGEKR
jgi:hypothetical protein